MVNSLKLRLKAAILPHSIVAVYIYGSILKGKFRTESDVDIAFLPLPGLSNQRKLRLISKVEAVFTTLLKDIGIDKEVSVLDMRGKYTSIELLYRIVSEGMLLYDIDISQRLEFENTVKREYFDFAPYLKNLRERKYGHLYQKA